jgi:hypothetical protein
MAATSMAMSIMNLSGPAATAAFSGLHDIAASDSGKVEITHQRPSGVSAHDRHKMKKAARASTEPPRQELR